jgi:fibronectin-binding autotransporter adhesin
MTQEFDSLASNTVGRSLVYVNRLSSGFDRLSNRLSGWTSWYDSYGVGAAIAGNGNASGLTYSTGGLAIGMERFLDEYTLLGIGGGYSSSATTLDSRSDRGAIDGGQFVAYMHRDVDSRYLTGIAAYGANTYDTRRYIDFASIDRIATANYDGSNYSAYLEAGQNILGRILNLQPFAGLEYIGVQQSAFTEHGANSVDLQVSDSTANAFRGLLGTRLLNYYRTKSDHLITLDASAAWRHEFLNDNHVIDALFAGQTGGAFAVSGANVDRDAAIIGTGLKCDLFEHSSIYANYDVLFSKDYVAHAGMGGFQYVW